jgi:hypothetical protein
MIKPFCWVGSEPGPFHFPYLGDDNEYVYYNFDF